MNLWRTVRQGARQLIAELETEPGGRVLDIGFAHDDRPDDVSSLGLRRYCVDTLPTGQAAGAASVGTVRMNARRNDQDLLEEESFDVVRCLVQRDDSIPAASRVRELNRYVRPSGYLMLAVSATPTVVEQLQEVLQDLGHAVVARRPVRWRPDISGVSGKFARTLIESILSFMERVDRHEWSFFSGRASCLLLTSRKKTPPTRLFQVHSTVDRPRHQNVEDHFDASKAWQGRLYDEPTDRFAKAVVRRQKYTLELLRRNTGVSQPGRVLDAGCGGGTYLAALKKEGWDVYGADISDAMIDAARKRLGLSDDEAARRLMRSDVTSLPFEDACFDAVVCVGVLGYVDDPQRAVAELTRILTPGGLLALSVDNMFSITHADFVFRKWLARGLGGRWADGRTAGRPFRTIRSVWMEQNTEARIQYDLFDPWSLERWLGREGYERVDRRTFGFELRWLRGLGLLNERTAESTELIVERMIHRSRLPYIPLSGDVYIGIFRKRGVEP